MSKEHIIQEMQREKIIAIARGLAFDQAVSAAKALYEGGIHFMEVTFDASGKIDDAEVGIAIAAIVKELDGKMHVGAGTVLTTRQVELTKKSGGEFIISPDTNGEIIQRTLELDMVSIPGAMTPTEVITAHNYGADFVKVFPASNLGAAYIKAILAPLSNIRLMAVGGISDSNITEFLAAGCVGAGIGGNLVSRKAIDSGNYEALTEYAQKTIAAAKN